MAADNRAMPWWDQADDQDTIARLLRELRSAEDLCAELPAASRDRAFIEKTIAVLNLQLAELLRGEPPS